MKPIYKEIKDGLEEDVIDDTIQGIKQNNATTCKMKKMKSIILKMDMKKKKQLNIIQYGEEKNMKLMEKLLVMVKERDIMIIGLLQR